MLKQRAIQLFYRFVDFFGWVKIPIATLATIYSILVTIDTNSILCGFHPAIVFLHWFIFDHKFIWLITSLSILTFIAILEKCAIGSYTKLKQELKEKEEKLDILNNYIKELFDGLLMSFANAELAFGTHEQNQERISLYLAKKDNNNNIDYLYPIGRYSSNPTFRNVRRSRYSVKKGCIGEAYKNDFCYNPNITLEECLKKYSYTKDEYKAMRMKPKTIAAISVKDKSNRVVGVLVAESQEKSWLSGSIRRKLEKQIKYYADICTILKDYIDDKVENKLCKKEDMPW